MTDTLNHGTHELPHVRIGEYSLEMWGPQGLIGDEASGTAFRELLGEWQRTLECAGQDPLGPRAAERLSWEEISQIAREGGTEGARMVAGAIGEFSDKLAEVIQRFLAHQAWRGVERIVIGGGFKESDVGRLAIMYTGHRLSEQGVDVKLQSLTHAADDGGLVGWVQLLPPAHAGRSFLAVDIGGTNARCGIVSVDDKGRNGEGARVVAREKWRHAASDAPDKDLIEGIVEMLNKLITRARSEDIALAPFIGVACPGLIRGDGSIERGAQNLPEDWQQASFHLPRRLAENIPAIEGSATQVLMHNDAVVQGLSELPYIQEVRRWAVLTIGTGLGNASYTNLR